MADWMLWGRFGSSIQLGSAPPPRLYLIPLSPDIEHEGPLAPEMGHFNWEDRSLEGVTRALDRAVSGEYDGVIFPTAILERADRFEIYSRCQSRALRVVHQVTSESLQPEGVAGFRFSLNGSSEKKSVDRGLVRLEEVLKRLDAGDAVNLVFGANSTLSDTLLARLTRWPEQIYFTYSVRADDPIIQFLHGLQPFVRERLFFHFPYHLDFGDRRLSCREIFEVAEKIHTRIPGVRVRPMLGTENFDPRVDPDLELEPTHRPSFETVSRGSLGKPADRHAIEISVIIPSYNNRDYLLNTIKHLQRQDLETDKFEVIVVDDGSNDGSQTAVQNLVSPLNGQFNLKYIYSPRSKPRKMGDANYRAGISRNLGVKNSSGRILSFLDSDILTPPHFLRDLIEKHKRFDVIQCKRLNLVQEKSNAEQTFESIDPNRDTFLSEGGYWERFYSLDNWSKEPFFWKYTCTYGLSVPASLFKRVGWIRRGFVFYGFEDVELGYRLARVGSRFHLNDVVTYHLFHRTERSEFHNSDYLRQLLLAKTAQIFYLGLLEPEIFVHFRGLMKEQLPVSSFFRWLASRLGLAPTGPRLLVGSRVPASGLASSKSLPSTLWSPIIAIWNWRWFLWRQLQAGKRVPLLRPFAIATEKVLRFIEARLKLVNKSYREHSANGHLRLIALLFALMPRSVSAPIGKLAQESWRVSVAAKRMAGALQLWRLRVAAQWVLSKLWLVKVPTIRFLGFLNRLWAKVPVWRLRELFNFIAGRLWLIKVFGVRLRGHLQLAIAKLKLWRILVFVEELFGQTWRIGVLVNRVRAQAWRIGAWESRFQGFLARLLGEVRRAVGSVYGRSLLFRTFAINNVWLPMSKIFWHISYPIRKVYYFLRYQFESRWPTKKSESSSIMDRREKP